MRRLVAEGADVNEDEQPRRRSKRPSEHTEKLHRTEHGCVGVRGEHGSGSYNHGYLYPARRTAIPNTQMLTFARECVQHATRLKNTVVATG